MSNNIEVGTPSCPYFCPDCPMRGSVEGPITGIETRMLGKVNDFTGSNYVEGRVGVIMDALKRTSAVIYIPTTITAETLLSRIEACEYPDYKEEGRFKKRTKLTCRAIGNLACTDKKTIKLVRAELG
jgi:hypothetical protein